MGYTMNSIFLSASVPVPGRGRYYETANPFLIQMAVRELLTLAIGRRRIVWGGHPAITPMVWSVCEDLGVRYSDAVVLYQSRFFEDIFPEENARFANVHFVDPVENDRILSLQAMRKAMLSQEDLDAAVFIGGMEGILEEYELFTDLHPKSKIVPVPAPGGAARDLAAQLQIPEAELGALDFSNLFWRTLGISPLEQRQFLPNESGKREG
jgi:SLOG cluster3 family